MSVYTRSGRPQIVRTAITGPQATKVSFQGRTAYLQINTDVSCNVYFRAQDAAGLNNNFVTVTSTAPFAGPADVEDIWVVSSGTSNIVAIGYVSPAR